MMKYFVFNWMKLKDKSTLNCTMYMHHMVAGEIILKFDSV